MGESTDGPDAVADGQLTPGEARLLAGYIALFGEGPLVRARTKIMEIERPRRAFCEA